MHFWTFVSSSGVKPFGLDDSVVLFDCNPGPPDGCPDVVEPDPGPVVVGTLPAPWNFGSCLIKPASVLIEGWTVGPTGRIGRSPVVTVCRTLI